MNKIIPIGYSKKSMGIFLAVAIAVGTLLLTFLLVKGGADFSAMKYFCITAGVLALLCVISDVTTNRKNKAKIAHMQYMLSCPSVTAEVSEIKRIPYYFGREFKKNRIFHAMGHNVVYRLVVSFHSPVTDKEEIIVSEAYSRNVASYVKDNKVAVHYSQDGEYWVEVYIPFAIV